MRMCQMKDQRKYSEILLASGKVAEPVLVYGAEQARGYRKMDTAEVVGRIQAGLPMVEFEALQALLGVTAEELAQHLAISRSTLARRRRSGRLSTEESDRLVRFARLFARVEEVVGLGAAARAWLGASARALGGVTPLVYAETEAGAREVENLLGRIEHGVFS